MEKNRRLKEAYDISKEDFLGRANLELEVRPTTGTDFLKASYPNPMAAANDLYEKGCLAIKPSMEKSMTANDMDFDNLAARAIRSAAVHIINVAIGIEHRVDKLARRFSAWKINGQNIQWEFADPAQLIDLSEEDFAVYDEFNSNKDFYTSSISEEDWRNSALYTLISNQLTAQVIVRPEETEDIQVQDTKAILRALKNHYEYLLHTLLVNNTYWGDESSVASWLEHVSQNYKNKSNYLWINAKSFRCYVPIDGVELPNKNKALNTNNLSEGALRAICKSLGKYRNSRCIEMAVDFSNGIYLDNKFDYIYRSCCEYFLSDLLNILQNEELQAIKKDIRQLTKELKENS